MKVLYVVSAYPRASGDIITPWLVETIRRLGRAGVEVEVLAPAYRGGASAEIDGVMVHRFRYAPRSCETLTHDQTAPDRVRERPWFLGLVPPYVAAGAVAAIRVSRARGISIVHAFWPLPHGLIALAPKFALRLPLVTTFFGVELTWMRSQLPFLRPVLRRIVRASDEVTVISSYTAELLREAEPSVQSSVVPFGAAVSVATEWSAKAGGRGAYSVLFVGRLVERKGVSTLLRAAKELTTRGEVQVRIVGDGPLRRQLEAECETLRLSGVVRFEGTVSDQELVERFRACDVLVLPAVVDAKGDTEGLGVVLIEALSQGKPVIASDVGGIRDIVIDGETGLLVPPGDATALAGALERYRSDPELARRLAEAGAEHVRRRFSWDAIIERLRSIYERLDAERTSRPGSSSDPQPPAVAEDVADKAGR